jgi:hypothetical protein
MKQTFLVVAVDDTCADLAGVVRCGRVLPAVRVWNSVALSHARERRLWCMIVQQ